MREELAQRIENEFVEAQYPGDKNIGVREVEDFIGQKEWRKVPLAVLARNQAAILIFFPAAYRFYLPAFLCAVLRHPELEYLEDPIMYSLIPSITPDNPNIVPEPAIPLFSKGEKLLVIEFLEKHEELFPRSNYVVLDDNVPELQRAVKFWKEN
jgi:hypothetical protein